MQIPLPVVTAANVVSQPPLPSVAVATMPPPVPNASVTRSVTKATPAATPWSKLTNWARQEWKFLAGGVGAGIALGGTMWLVLAMQAPSEPVVTELPGDSALPTAAASDSAPLASTNPPKQSAVVPAATVDEENTEKQVPSQPTANAARDTQDPLATHSTEIKPIAAEALDKPANTTPAQAAVPPAATDDKTPPLAATPRPTIKLEPAPVKSGATELSSEAASILNAAPADAAADTPAAVRTPAADSPGAQRPELTKAEIDERLSRALPSAQFTKVPLFQFVEFVAELTNLPIQLDEPALKLAGKSRQSAVTVKLNETTAGDALRAGLSDLGLVTALRSGVVVVTVAPEGKSAKQAN
jgi:hypothetical protein